MSRRPLFRDGTTIFIWKEKPEQPLLELKVPLKTNYSYLLMLLISLLGSLFYIALRALSNTLWLLFTLLLGALLDTLIFLLHKDLLLSFTTFIRSVVRYFILGFFFYCGATTLAPSLTLRFSRAMIIYTTTLLLSRCALGFNNTQVYLVYHYYFSITFAISHCVLLILLLAITVAHLFLSHVISAPASILCAFDSTIGALLVLLG